MSTKTWVPLLLLTFLATPGLRTATAQDSEQWRAMNRPVEPFRILGNLYYVGASSVASYLITTPEGHILIDSGFEETVPLIRSGIETLGFEVEDVKLLLASHAHLDHVGGMAKLKKETGAIFLASEKDAPLLERGGLGDDLWGDEIPFDPISVDRRLKDGETVKLGGMKLTAHITAGHTRGCTSWELDIVEGKETYKAVSICSLSVLDGMKFLSTPPTYPGIYHDFRRSFEILEALPAQIFLASHAEFFRLEEKRSLLEEPGPNPFIDPEGYRRYISRARERFEKAVKEEQEEGKERPPASR